MRRFGMELQVAGCLLLGMLCSATTVSIAAELGPALKSLPTGDVPPLTIDNARAEASDRFPRGDKALLIGINDYAGSDSDLHGAVDDARAISTFLVNSLGWNPDDVYVLVDQRATAINIATAIKTLLIESTNPGDRVFLYYSGHGTQIPDENGDEKDGRDEVIVAADLIPVVDDLFDSALQRIADRRVTVVFDSCFSGTATRDLDDPVLASRLWRSDQRRALVSRSRNPPDLSNSALTEASQQRIVWSAVSDSEEALEDVNIQPARGVFTSRFIEGVAARRADRSGDGRVTNGELLDYVREESAEFCNNARGCRSLTPQLEPLNGLTRMDFITGEKVEDPAPPTQLGSSGVRVVIEPSNNFKLGQRIRFRVSSDMPGHLLLLDFGASGNLTQLFPNTFLDRSGLDDRIAPDEPVLIPDQGYGFEIEASPPTGQGHLFAVVTDQPLRVEEIAESRRDLRPIEASDKFLDDLSERLRRTRVDANGITGFKFVAAHLPYTIQP